MDLKWSKVNFKKLLIEHLIRHEKIIALPDQHRIRHINLAFSGCTAKLPSDLLRIVQWFKSNEASMDCILLWGSYIVGRESNFSFSIKKVGNKQKEELIVGPSDIDALLVTKKDIIPPELMKEYAVLDENLEIKDIIKLNIFKDIFIFKKENLLGSLLDLPEKYLECYLIAAFKTGLLLKNNSHITDVLKKILQNKNIQKNTLNIMRIKRQKLFDRLQAVKQPECYSRNR